MQRLAVGGVVVSLALGATGACGGGDGDASTPTAPPAPTTTTELVQEQFAPAMAAPVLAAFAGGVDPRFEYDQDSLTVVDPSRGELEFDSSALRERFEFARQQGLLGLFSGEYLTTDGEESWGLTTEVFGQRAGAEAVYERHGNPDSIEVGGTTTLEETEVPYAEGRVGALFVEVFQYDDGRLSYGLRASLVDGNVLHHAAGLIDVEPGEAFDPYATLRRAMGAIDGVYAREFVTFGGGAPEGTIPGEG